MTTALNKKALLSMLAASAVAVATPALAQNVGLSVSFGSPGYSQAYGPGYGHDRARNLDARADQLAQRIDRAAYNGAISRRDAHNLRQELSHYQRLAWSYSRNGLTRWERDDLQRRLDRIQYELREARRDGGRRGRW